MNTETVEIPCISLWQPWASLIGLKQYETRHWQTKYRGRLAIHAAKRPMGRDEKELLDRIKKFTGLEDHAELFDKNSYPYGAVVKIVDLNDCLEMIDLRIAETIEEAKFPPNSAPPRGKIIIQHQTYLERLIGNWKDGRFAWQLDNVFTLPEPIFCKGKQGFFRIQVRKFCAETELQRKKNASKTIS